MRQFSGEGSQPLPTPLPRWGGDTLPKPHPTPLFAYGASTLTPSAFDLPPVNDLPPHRSHSSGYGGWIWTTIQERVYHTDIQGVDELKQRLIQI